MCLKKSILSLVILGPLIGNWLTKNHFLKVCFQQLLLLQFLSKTHEILLGRCTLNDKVETNNKKKISIITFKDVTPIKLT